VGGMWIGTEAGLAEAMRADPQQGTPQVIQHFSFEKPQEHDYFGIEPPPADADHVIFDPPIEADGSATWRWYKGPRGASIVAPECELYAMRWVDDA
jgi:hypothetical protein